MAIFSRKTFALVIAAAVAGSSLALTVNPASAASPNGWSNGVATGQTDNSDGYALRVIGIELPNQIAR
jgi:hypothetical protein